MLDRAPGFQIQPADLVFVRSAGIIPGIVERVTHSIYYHVAGVVQANELVEAQGLKKTGYQAEDAYDGCADVFRCIDLTPTEQQQVVQYALGEIGTRYDYLLIAWEGIRYLLHVLLPYYEGNRRICSTLWSDAYKSAGIDLCPGVRYPSPADLAASKRLHHIGSY